VLLVDDDEGEVGDGREYGRPGADRDSLAALAQGAPLVVALPGGERGVEHRDLVAETGPEAGQGLRGEGDLRDQHDRRAPRREQRLHQLEVDEGLSGARDASQEGDSGSRSGGPGG
jgi:hypothetical protein